MMILNKMNATCTHLHIKMPATAENISRLRQCHCYRNLASAPIFVDERFSKMFVIFVWSIRAPSQAPDWHPVILTYGVLELCDIMLALRHFGLNVSNRFFECPPPNVATWAELVILTDPIRDSFPARRINE